MSVGVLQKRPNNSRLDSPACLESQPWNCDARLGLPVVMSSATDITQDELRILKLQITYLEKSVSQPASQTGQLCVPKTSFVLIG